MPGRGNNNHGILITEALKKLADTHRDKLWKIDIETVKLDVTTSLVFRDYGHGQERADRDFYPDIVAVTKTKDTQFGEKYVVHERFIIECENGMSTLISGNPSIRNYGYKMLREKNKDFLKFILVTWERYRGKVKNSLWDEVWYIPNELKEKVSLKK